MDVADVVGVRGAGRVSGEVHVVVITHTADRLERTLAGVRWQTRPPDSLVISVDGDGDELEAGIRAACARAGVSATLVLRERPEVWCLAQIRNNAVRALLARGVDPGAGLVWLDGDCVPAPEIVAGHAERLTRAELVLAHRFDLTEAQTGAFDPEALRDGRWPYGVTDQQRRALARRDRRYRRQWLCRRLGLGKAHKPKILGGHFGTRVDVWRRVNGQDETFTRWGQEDDDFARRVYAAGGRPSIAIGALAAFHQWHPTRAPGRWHDGTNASRLDERFETVCASGLEGGRAQAAPRVVEVPGGPRGPRGPGGPGGPGEPEGPAT